MQRECIECGDPIAQKRLAAVPHAVRCVACQSIEDIENPRRVVLDPAVQRAMAVGGAFDADMMAELANSVRG